MMEISLRVVLLWSQDNNLPPICVEERNRMKIQISSQLRMTLSRFMHSLQVCFLLYEEERDRDGMINGMLLI